MIRTALAALAFSLLTVTSSIATHTKPSKTGAWYVRTVSTALDVVVADNHAFVADGASGLLVIDVTDAAAPALVGSLDTEGVARGVAVSGKTVFIADGGAGLQIIDVSDPAVPTWLGTYDTPGMANGVSVAGNFAYVADGASGLLVIDVSDPARPTRSGELRFRRCGAGCIAHGQECVRCERPLGHAGDRYPRPGRARPLGKQDPVEAGRQAGAVESRAVSPA